MPDVLQANYRAIATTYKAIKTSKDKGDKIMLLNKQSLAIAALAPKEESRYAPSAVNVTDKETVVTNGHYCIRVSHPQVKPDDYPSGHGADWKPQEPFLIDAKEALKVVKAIPLKVFAPILKYAAISQSEDAIKAVTGEVPSLQTLVSKPIAGQFPAFEKVYSTEQPVFEITLNPEYLAAIGKLLTEFIGDSEYQKSVLLRFYGSLSGCRIDAANKETGQEMNVALMPIKSAPEITYKNPAPVEQKESVAA